MAAISMPLYLGLDLSTQQLKALVMTADLKVVHEVKVDFDIDTRGFNVTKGVITNETEHEVYAPIAMWLQAVDGVLARLKDAGLDLARVKAISGAGQQHGSVYWSRQGEAALGSLDPEQTLEVQLADAFSHPFSPNWQDASTQRECDEFDRVLGGEVQLAEDTGSKSHHRFTGPQILRFQRKQPDAYARTSRISLVSSFLASILLGRVAPTDVADVCGMNLWSIPQGAWNLRIMSLASNSHVADLTAKLGPVRADDSGGSMGALCPYFVRRYGFSSDCCIAPFTGDNPATILALPLRPLDAIVSLGTSTTFLMSTPNYRPDPAVHFFNHPTTKGLYMFMLCYKNGSLAREQVRDASLAKPSANADAWSAFNQTVLASPPLGRSTASEPMKLGLYFPRPEIVPRVPAGTWRFTYEPSSMAAPSPKLTESAEAWDLPHDDARAIIESQLLSLRLRSAALVEPPDAAGQLPPQPRRVYLVGGGARNPAIARLAGEVLGGAEGVYRLDVGANACALGAAYKAVWAVERAKGETFEEYVGKRWKERDFVEKIDDGYREDVFKEYGKALHGFEEMEKRVLDATARFS